MDFRTNFLACSLALASLSACQADRIGIPPQEEFAREFIKEFGLIDPNHDWSLIKQGSIDISCQSPTDVRIYTIVDGKTQLLANYQDVNGTQTLTFDVLNNIENVLVQTDGFFEEVKIGSTVNVSASRASRAINGTDQLAVAPEIKNGYYREYKFVEAFNHILPEYSSTEGRALKNYNITTDFSFVSTGKPFVFYPIYWNTGGKNTLGVYWYENGELKTQDLFDNYILNADGSQNKNNMYRKGTQEVADLVATQYTPADKSTDITLRGEIVVEFNLDIKATQWGRATLRLATNPTVSQAFLKTITVSGNKAIFAYEGLSPNTEYIFTIPARRFAPVGEKDNTNNYSKEVSFSFTTLDTNLKLVKISPADDKASEHRTNGRSGTVVLTYNQAISKASDALPSMVSVDGKSTATVTGPVISGSTLTYGYSGAQYDTPYNFTLPEGVVCSSESATSLNNERVFRFMTQVSPDEYVYNDDLTDVPLLISETNKVFAANANIVDETVPFKALLTKEINMDKRKTKAPWNFSETFTSNHYVSVQNISKGVPSESQPLAGGARSDEWKSLLLITPDQDLKLTVYFGSKTELYPPRLYDQTSFRIFDMGELGVKAGPDKDSYYWTSCTYEIRAGRTYLLYSPNDTRVAGFAYQTLKQIIEKAEPASTITETIFSSTSKVSRAGKNDTPTYAVQTYQTEEEIINAGYTQIPYAEKRASSYIKYEAGKGGKDDVVTHQISVTIPKGRVFGFYIRNNSGAKDITYTGNEPKAFYNYSMSTLNKEMSNSFFNSLISTGDATQYTKGWTKFDKIDHEVDANRKYSTAATYSVDIEGDNYRYFSFEDWLDCDFNDIVFLVDPESEDIPVVDLEIETNPSIVAVEDLGAISSSDIDFNDIVFAVEHIQGQTKAFVTMLAAGGILETQLLYNGKVVGKNGADGIGTVVAGPGVGRSLNHINEWFDEPSHRVVINAGSGNNYGFGNLTTVEIEVDQNFSLAERMEFEGAVDAVDNLSGFSVRVMREDGEQTTITRPDGKGQAPQMLVLPKGWYWPKEGIAIHDAYSGGLSSNGDRMASFQDWVNNKYGINENWYTNHTEGHVVVHAWNGSEPAREHARQLLNK